MGDLPHDRILLSAALLRAAPTLTPAELRVCHQLLEGQSSAAIATRLGRSARTIENHRLSIRRKIGAREHLSVELENLVGRKRPL